MACQHESVPINALVCNVCKNCPKCCTCEGCQCGVCRAARVLGKVRAKIVAAQDALLTSHADAKELAKAAKKECDAHNKATQKALKEKHAEPNS